MSSTHPIYEQAVLRALQEQGPLSLSSLQQQIRGQYELVEATLKELLEKGGIEHYDPAGQWETDQTLCWYQMKPLPGAHERSMIEQHVKEIRQEVLGLLRQRIIAPEQYRNITNTLEEVQECVRKTLSTATHSAGS